MDEKIFFDELAASIRTHHCRACDAFGCSNDDDTQEILTEVKELMSENNLILVQKPASITTAERIDAILAECLAKFKISKLSQVCRTLVYEFSNRLETAILCDLSQGLHDQHQTITELRKELRKSTAREKQWQILAGTLASAANTIYCELRVSPSSKPTPNGIDQADNLHSFVIRHLPLDDNE